MTDVQTCHATPEHRAVHTIRSGLERQRPPGLFLRDPQCCDDAHDCSLAVADAWLKTNIDPLINNASFQKNGLLIIYSMNRAAINTNGEAGPRDHRKPVFQAWI